MIVDIFWKISEHFSGVYLLTVQFFLLPSVSSLWEPGFDIQRFHKGRLTRVDFDAAESLVCKLCNGKHTVYRDLYKIRAAAVQTSALRILSGTSSTCFVFISYCTESLRMS